METLRELTKEQVINDFNKYTKDKNSVDYKPYIDGKVLSKEEINERFKHASSITVHTFTINDQHYEFFSNNHIFGHGLWPVEVTSTTFTVPLTAEPREGLESGLVNNVDEYFDVFKPYLILFSFDEVLETMLDGLVYTQTELLD